MPKLRFPEFCGDDVWNEMPLDGLSKRIRRKVGSKELTPVSITAGFGFVDQTKKFGRRIAGEQYKNYIHIQRGDFVYNKGNSKTFAQGCIYQLKEFEEAAASTAFICFKLNASCVDIYFQNLFECNTHGRKLLKFITSGARSDGLLNINPTDFFSIELPLPPRKEEQQRIAECLSSVDEVIAAEARKLDALKSHKKGLMQELFPREGETQPRLRFPQFQDAPEWSGDSLGQIFKTSSGGTPSRSKEEYWNGNIPWITTSLVDFNVITKADEFISDEGLKNSSAKVFPEKTILVAMYGQGKTRGQVAILGIKAATNQACAAILPRKNMDPNFVFMNLASRYEEMRGLSNSGGQKNLSQGLIQELQFSYPNDIDEQQVIAECLTFLDDLIVAQAQKLEALKAHKKGLMQQLFPSPESNL
jgi:type I restriction enzyme S subunit